MRVAGERSFEAPVRTVWEVLNDPARMAKTMPGVESFDVIDDRHWRANVKVPLGLGALALSITFTKVEEREPEYAKLHAKGNGVGAIMNMETQFHLSGSGDTTRMRWEADVRIAGPVGSMGQRVLQPIVNQQVQNVLTMLDRQIEEAHGHSEDARTPPQESGSGGGTAGAPDPTTDADTHTDPKLKDYGPPAQSTPDPDPASVEGKSGAEEGINPWAPAAYDEDPEGPTTSTDDR